MPQGNQWGYVFAERSSKEMIQPGFPVSHRDDRWNGENSRYAKSVGRYCSTVFGEFKSALLEKRADLWSGSDPKWRENVTEVIMQEMIEAEEDRS